MVLVVKTWLNLANRAPLVCFPILTRTVCKCCTRLIIKQSCSVFNTNNKGLRFNLVSEPKCAISGASEMAADITSAKPPNIVIYDNGNADEQTGNIQAMLENCADPDKYVFLRLNQKQLLSDPWHDNAELIVIKGNCISEADRRVLLKFWHNNGKILSICSSFIRNLDIAGRKFCFPSVVDNDVQAISHKIYGEVKLPINKMVPPGIHSADSPVESIAVDQDNNWTVIGAIRDDSSDGIIVFSQVYLGDDEENDCNPSVTSAPSSLSWKRNVLRSILTDVFCMRCVSDPVEAPKVTPCYVYTRDAPALDFFLNHLKPHLRNGGRLERLKTCLRLSSVPCAPHSVTEDGAGHDIPIIYDPSSVASSPSTWVADVYFDNLKTQVLGQVVWYGEVLTSTMDLLNCQDIPQEVVCIAGRQTKGKGRGGHVWLSPEGCAMFSLQISISLHSLLGRRLPFVQHLASLAIIEGILSLPGYEDLNLKLKWPNDVYFGDQVKLGGVVVQSSLLADTAYCTIGCGINIRNKKPTLCLDDVVKAANPELQTLSREQVIARAINRLEELIAIFQQSGSKHILPLYYSRWLHGAAQVKLATADGKLLPATVLGLDDSGFLSVQLEESVSTCSVQPNGNSFDMLHNLIIVRNNTST